MIFGLRRIKNPLRVVIRASLAIEKDLRNFSVYCLEEEDKELVTFFNQVSGPLIFSSPILIGKKKVFQLFHAFM